MLRDRTIFSLLKVKSVLINQDLSNQTFLILDIIKGCFSTAKAFLGIEPLTLKLNKYLIIRFHFKNETVTYVTDRKLDTYQKMELLH